MKVKGIGLLEEGDHILDQDHDLTLGADHDHEIEAHDTEIGQETEGTMIGIGIVEERGQDPGKGTGKEGIDMGEEEADLMMIIEEIEDQETMIVLQIDQRMKAMTTCRKVNMDLLMVQ